jgi:WD40 repeat protein
MESIVKNNFKDHMPPWLSFPPLVEQKWDSCLQVWEGHSKTVQSIAFSHDSTLVASASLDGTIRIWLASTGNCLQDIKGHSGTVSYINFSPDSSLLLSISTDYSIRIWRPETGDCVRTLRSYTSDPDDTQRDYIEDCTSAAFSHNGRFVVSGHQDNTVRIWNVDTGECMRQLLGHKKRVQSVVFSHDSTLVASVSRDKTARIWNTDSGACKYVLRHAKNSPYKVFFRHDSKLLASFSTGNFVRFWQVDTGSCERIIQLESNDIDFWISDLSQDWNYILSHSPDKI